MFASIVEREQCGCIASSAPFNGEKCANVGNAANAKEWRRAWSPNWQGQSESDSVGSAGPSDSRHGMPSKGVAVTRGGGTAGMLSVAMRSRLQLGNRTTELDITCLHGGIVERLAERVREATMFVGVPLGLTQNEVRA
jgi:hypothetical protein